MNDELFDDDHTFGDDPSRIVAYARTDPGYPGGVYYRMQYYDTEVEETILRYDNAHDADVGPHHRHRGNEVEGIEFTNIDDHYDRFLKEVEEIHDQRTQR